MGALRSLAAVARAQTSESGGVAANGTAAPAIAGSDARTARIMSSTVRSTSAARSHPSPWGSPRFSTHIEVQWELPAYAHFILLGMNRGRYFLLTGQTLDAAEALRLGLVAEVLPADRLLARAWQLAEDLVRKPTLLLRYTRLLFTEYLGRQMHDLLGYGLAMESLALFEKPETP